MLRFARAGLLLILGAVAGASFGCGSQGGVSTNADSQDIFHQNMLSEVGEILVIRKSDTNAPPKSLADLTRYQSGWPAGYTALKEGGVVVAWGESVQEGASDKILAYQKEAAESGGYVLMQDGRTVKKMTADEFKSAKKAGKD